MSNIATLCDRFDQAAINTYLWTAPTSGNMGTVTTAIIPTSFTLVPGYGAVALSGAVSIPALLCADTEYPYGNLTGIQSVSPYDLTGSGVSLEFIGFTGTVNPPESYGTAVFGVGNFQWNIYIDPTNTTLIQLAVDDPTGTTVITNMSINELVATYRFLRIWENSGTVYFDHSSDGVTWTNDFNTTYSVDITSLYVQVTAQGADRQGPATFTVANLDYVL
jgi:hypothetical protein